MWGVCRGFGGPWQKTESEISFVPAGRPPTFPLLGFIGLVHARRHGPDFARPAIPVHPGPLRRIYRSERTPLVRSLSARRFILMDGHISPRIYRLSRGRLHARPISLPSPIIGRGRSRWPAPFEGSVYSCPFFGNVDAGSFEYTVLTRFD